MPFSEIEDVVVTYKFCFAKTESKITNGDHEPVIRQPVLMQKIKQMIGE